ncbi:thiol:disulfide interchange protein DsbA/DsbL [Methylomagnum ishizawai]|uniref:thiol:disulfide interchange protein DsbA/DsbL n=1 Tax=Methylomagnum ishizawai TaxID=1760988 RepID=UPI001C3214BA|nr:thiol:disulfide interchange protein DsbA/DsbL [Methylomagnum ishizawai]BBL73556.1 thiol:disulfide interchange protein [Methylomagnum ishizawai]
MKLLFGFMAGWLLLSAPVFAEEFKAGTDYDTINPAQPTSDPSKVEVMEFFWYGCPHCYHFEPDLNNWVRSKPQNVVFIRQPAVFNEHWRNHAKAFFTAEALGVVEKVHADFFDAIQNKHQTLESEKDLGKFFVAHGVKEDDFKAAFKSFAVDSKLRQAEGMAARYGVTGTPSIVVNGKYLVGPAKAKSFARMIEITNALIKKETEAKPPVAEAHGAPPIPEAPALKAAH